MRPAAFSTLLIAVSLLLATSAAQATNWGDFNGTTVVFESVDDVDDLFGQPTVSANSLDFNPTGFETACDSGPCPSGSEIVEGQLVFTVQALAGNFVESIILSEAGDFLIGTFNPGDIASTSVSANVVGEIIEVDGVAVNDINFNQSMVFTNGGAFTRQESVDGIGTSSGGWSGLLNIDVNALVAGAGYAPGSRATRVRLSIDNFLTAFNNSDPAIAFIEKKDFDGLAVTVVPEPGTALLFGLGLAGLASIRRDRTS